jgi:peroxiredoxin (alkyl hydroperoxide reductase subunit C)
MGQVSMGMERHPGMEHHMGMGYISESLPLLGDKMPRMEVKTTHGMMTLPDAFAGKWFVLFSHPGDFTPVCTTEFVSFEKRHEEFEKLNCELIGLSIDQVTAHMKWTQWIKENLNVEIKFPIIADDLGKIAARMGMIHPGKGTNTVRSVFIIDPEATIRFGPLLSSRNWQEYG